MWVAVDKFDSRLRELEGWIRSHEGYEDVYRIITVFREDVEDVLRYAYLVYVGQLHYRRVPRSLYPAEYVREPFKVAVIVHEESAGVEQFQWADFPEEVKLWLAGEERGAALKKATPAMYRPKLNFTIEEAVLQDHPYAYITTGDKYLWADGTVHDSVVTSKLEFHIQGRFRDRAEAAKVLDAYNATFE